MKYLCEQKIRAKMISKECFVQVVDDIIEFDENCKGYISVFSLSDASVVTIENLQEKGLVKKVYNGVKVLGDGKLEVALTVKANKFSKAAEAAITSAGGTIEVI